MCALCFLIGCIIREPSFDLGVKTVQRALWAVTSFNEGDTIGDQGSWGKFAVRKPNHDCRTVQLGLDVTVQRGERKSEVTKPLLVVGDERCALTYINDPTRGVAKRKGVQANCKLVCSNDWDMMRNGNTYVSGTQATHYTIQVTPNSSRWWH